MIGSIAAIQGQNINVGLFEAPGDSVDVVAALGGGVAIVLPENLGEPPHLFWKTPVSSAIRIADDTDSSHCSTSRRGWQALNGQRSPHLETRYAFGNDTKSLAVGDTREITRALVGVRMKNPGSITSGQ